MRDWAAAKGRAANKVDWDAAFRGWLRRSAERKPLAQQRLGLGRVEPNSAPSHPDRYKSPF